MQLSVIRKDMDFT